MMKTKNYFLRLLSFFCLGAFFNACSPEYGAHFQASNPPNYAHQQESRAPSNALVQQESPLTVLEKEVGLQSGAEDVQSDALPAARALTALSGIKDFPEVEDTKAQQQEVLRQVHERLENMSRKEKKALRREIRQLRLSTDKEYLYDRAEEFGIEQTDIDENMALLIILAILIPPLAVFLHQGEINKKFWISLLLTLLFFLPGAIYSVLVVLGEL
ncbi:YqaE/Pmp3 family membrane protein [Nafulsella turpanensis]|uniref:YqaE/Pmp3 family membrane protein n=1 Tax=Nafulsella turpanensis TaxID=1265690 RepID=UPI00034D9C68|nr:YqaE/Pmp3 family membrane protein [Nafulsella turpanensis]